MIKEFYEGKNILITGATGFLGKVLLWKFCESLPNCGKIYVLLRSKNDTSAEKRLIQLLKNKPFSYNQKRDYCELLKKVVAIESDITSPELGLSETDRKLLIDQVNVVFHCAASVRFDAALKDNLRDNFHGSREIVLLCNQLPHLKALVHVSTAYSNCHQKFIDEELSPLNLDVDRAVQMIESLPSEACDAIESKLLEGRPNTYTYTKALAEHYVAKQEGKYPISIVRPSIVISAAEEPCTGWVDNVNGISGLGCLAAIGVLRTIDWNYYARSDMVPVDYVANNCICAAYNVAINSPKEVVFYNMTSGNLAPVSWGRFFESLRKNAVTTPPSKIVRPIIKTPKYHRVNRLKFVMTKYFSELLFACLVDIILYLIGYKKVMLKITRKMHHGYEILKPFTTNEWDFNIKNCVTLSDQLDDQDAKTFRFDMRNHDWDHQAAAVWEGGRTFLLKEDPTEESYQLSRSRMRMVTFVHYIGIAITACMTTLTCYAGFNLVRAHLLS